MNPSVAHIWRHPIKSHGREEIPAAVLTEGKCLPWDRLWAVAHGQSRFDAERPAWQPCSQFSIGAKSPGLQAITVCVDEGLNKITLSHPDRQDITIDPDNAVDADQFVQWVTPISNSARSLPTQLVSAAQPMTDTKFQSISIINLASHAEIEKNLETSLSPERWRGNIHVDGWAPWAEKDMVGKRIRIGTAELEVREEITRCMATTANVETGIRDADTLGALKNGFGHQEMGVYAVVIRSGQIRQEDQVEVLT
ncbi:hypothetical protein A9Q96_01105 [Rhodobacterales bacterium 52_120_T64]|nr:hypothetical protein A9Q96_01105 [Rhodobacterales bacterium 52_120_T64]